MDHDFQNSSIADKYDLVSTLLTSLAGADTWEEKAQFFYALPAVRQFLATSESLCTFLHGLSPQCACSMLSIIACGQGVVVFNSLETLENKFERLRALMHTLLDVEHFYSPIGGLIGYYHAVLKCLNATHTVETAESQYHYPPLNAVASDADLQQRYIKAGICGLPQMAEVYPIGGAGDRLNLCHAETKEPLPVAQLQFEGFSLLERLLLDLQAREYLYWKLHGQQLETPIVMMGSHEKNNISHLLALCQQKRWFGRSCDSIQLIVQPLVPQITKSGNFSLKDSLQLSLKPGGHGVLWQLAANEGVFDWLKARDRHKMLIRQINNPIAGVDDTLLTFFGMGYQTERVFGFVGCDRRVGAPEGMIVLKQWDAPLPCESGESPHFRYAITNVEYTNFQAKGLVDEPKEPGSLFSRFPANTNILFADIAEIERTLQKCALPGLLMNAKSQVPFIDAAGVHSNILGGRLESSMQNVADEITLDTLLSLEDLKWSDLPTYIYFARREKALSVTKNLYCHDKQFFDTPESCYLTLLSNCYELFSNYCGMEIPAVASVENYLAKGPSFIIRYTPLLGPLYEIIAEKIQRGTLHEGAELILDIAEVEIRDLVVAGSLQICAKELFGSTDPVTGKIKYGHGGGKCQLHQVRVANAGIDYTASHSYWKGDIQRKETLEIILHGNAEFYAEYVVFEGPHRIEVPAGQRLEARTANGQICYQAFDIDAPTWHWDYAFAENERIVINPKVNTATSKRKSSNDQAKLP